MAKPPLPATVESHCERRRHDWRRVTLGTALAFVVLLVLVSLAGAVLGKLSGADGSNAVDARVLEWMVDHRSDGLTRVMRAVTSLGGTLVLVPLTVVGVVLLCSMRRFWLACYLATVVIGASLLSSTAKAVVGRPRPPVEVRLTGVAGSAFPSGHSTQAAATYLAVAIVVGVVVASPAWRRVVWVLCAFIVVAVGVSRLYLGVHWFSDVVAGWLAGAAWALAAAAAFRPLGSPPVVGRLDRCLTELSSEPRQARSVRHGSSSPRNLPWPERWPLLGPATGVALAAAGTTVAINESDWGATTVFSLLATTLVLVGLRNYSRLSDRG